MSSKLTKAQLALVHKFADGFASSAAIVGNMRAEALSAAADAWKGNKPDYAFACSFVDAAIEERGLEGASANVIRSNMLAVFYGGACANHVLTVVRETLAKPPKGVSKTALQRARVIEHVSRQVKAHMVEVKGKTVTELSKRPPTLDELRAASKAAYSRNKAKGKGTDKAERKAENPAAALREAALYFISSELDWLSAGVVSDKVMEACATLTKEITDKRIAAMNEYEF